MTTKADVRSAVASAASEAVGDAMGDEGTASAENPSDQAPNSDASSEGQSANQDPSSTEGSESAASADATDVPEEYFGYRFPPDLTPEQRAEFIGELKKRDDTIGKLLRKDAPDPVEPTDEEPVPSLTDATDEEILQALGLDTDDPFMEQTAKAVIPVVRRQLEQEATISQLLQLQEAAEIDRSWRSSLSGLEREFGALPAEVTHDEVMEYAARENIGNPLDAYWRIVGPGRSLVEDMVQRKAASKIAEKKASSSTRPGGSTVEDEAPLESKTTKGATREAVVRQLREMGLDT